jgi:hypothetical protein
MALTEIRYLHPNRLNQLHRALPVVVPNELLDLLAVLVVLDELNHRRFGDLGAVMLEAETQHFQIGQVRALRKLLMVQQLIVGFLFYRCLDAVRRTQPFQ